MGLLDSLLKSGAIGNLAQQAISNPNVQQAVTSFLSPDDNSVGQNNGGLGGILDTLNSSGLGNVAASWLGNGRNEEISPSELESALGPDTLNQFAQKAGVEQQESAGILASLLPELVNQMTPKGDVPQGGQLAGILGQLLKR